MESELDELIEVLQDNLIERDVTFSVGDVLRLVQGRNKEETNVPKGAVTMQWVTGCKENPDEE
jgi:hypothetical protein